MVSDKIKVCSENSECYDKKQIALAIRNATFEDSLSCSLLEERVIRDCEGCSLKFICDGIDELSKDYIDHTTTVVTTFKFD
ncbi:hypothetical protein [Clostridium weizhouense]|uniref:Uncharacterized protein n=1 Tax=Clostridium weizhouense TaxID=2859781 RepID=A0ABS7AJG2_9CLOT|nr:hypothetical protein [Clostridium weizhouense]MBW6408777.1 hypothetical protein [Clostridium weizhouense]